METIISEETYLSGDKICVASSARAGYGTYVRDGAIYASLCGRVKLERELSAANPATSTTATRSSNEHLAKLTQQQLTTGASSTTANSVSSIPVVSIKTLKDHSVVLPHIGSLVMAKVTSVNPRYVKCSILSINNVIVKDKFSGQIK
jgi:exosome complex RNA-binding protein Csl4